MSPASNDFTYSESTRHAHTPPLPPAWGGGKVKNFRKFFAGGDLKLFFGGGGGGGRIFGGGGGPVIF